MKNVIALIGLTFCLQGCFFVAGAAAGVAAVAVVNDHRVISKTMQDTQIANKIVDKIKKNHSLDSSHIEVTCFNRVVLLTGETTNERLKQKAGELAESVSEATRVYNQLTIQGPTSSLTRTSDSWITTKIKSQMVATEDLKSGSIKVVTENGVVYLMGIVSHQQADIAVDIARQVAGVQKVMKIFQYSSKNT